MSDQVLPQTWANAPIGECCELNPKIDKSAFADSDTVHFVPMPAVEALTNKVDVSTTRPFSEVKKGYTPFTSGDVIFAKITPCMENGKIAVVPDLSYKIAFGSTEFHVLRPRGGLDPLWFFYFLSSRSFRSLAEHNMTGAVGQRRVPIDFLARSTIPLPPLAEQKRIVSKIEELFSELEAGDESLRAARRQLGVYRQSLLKQAFEGKLTEKWRTENPDKLEWRVCPLSAVVDFTSGFAFKSSDYADSGVPVVRISDVSEDGVSLENTVKIAPRPEFEKFRLRKGDILIAMSGATTGKFGELKSEEKCYLNQRVGCFRTKDERQFSQRFLHYLLHGLKRKIAKDAYGGAQPNISGKQINAYTVPCPSPEEQQEIVRLLDEQFEAIERNEREIDAALKRSEALRQAILKKAFTGQLVPQDPADEPASVLLARLQAERAQTPVAMKRTRNKASL